MKQVFGFFLLILSTLILAHPSLGKSIDPNGEISQSPPFEILYSETLPEAALQSLERPSNDQFSNSSFFTWSFEAFGKLFLVSLEPNSRLIAKVPTQKRAHIQQKLKFYRGTLEGIPGSWVRLTRIGGQWSGMIWDGQEAYIIDPMSVIASALRTAPTQTPLGHTIYRLSDTKDLGTRTCGLGGSGGMPTHPMPSFGALIEERQDRVGVAAQGATRNIDMTVECPPKLGPSDMLGFLQSEEDQHEEEPVHGRTDCANFTGCRNQND